MHRIKTLICLLVFAQSLFAVSKDIALFPQQNEFRNRLDLSGVWQFKADPKDEGEKDGWNKGLADATSIAVPGSWNDQIEGLRNYLGKAWYQTTAFVPQSWHGSRVMLRVGSAVYAAKVWINGCEAGTHLGGHLPFAIDISKLVTYNHDNRITICVENELRDDRVPGGHLKGGQMKNFPDANYDFFPYSGLNRAVQLYSVPENSISDITVTTALDGTVTFKIEKGGEAIAAKVVIGGKTVESNFKGNTATVKVKIPNVRLWSTEDPYLYQATVTLTSGRQTIDKYSCNVGVRTFTVDGNHLLLNGKPIKLRGFGLHEDFPIFGRGTALPVTIKDFELLKWTGANIVRTSHYPYNEDFYDLADKAGILVIDETPAVGLVFYDDSTKVSARLKQCNQYVDEMISRDKNHPSVVMWCVANEPNVEKKGSALFTGAEKSGGVDEHRRGADFLKSLMDRARTLDGTRPVTFTGVMGGPADWLAAADVVCVNRYFGWYTNVGDLPTALKYFGGELDHLHKQMPDKPIIVTEFGADAISGNHSMDGEIYSEEYQSQLISSYLDVANTKDYVSGMMIWNLADFRTGQAIIRMGGMNLKGIFTRERQPKAAAFMIHKRWTEDKQNY